MRFKFIGEAEAIFSHLIHAGDDEHEAGTTVRVKPGEEFDVAKDGVLIPSVVLHPELEAVDDEAKKLVTVEADKARVEAARVFGDVAAEAEHVAAEVAPPAAPAAAPAAPAAPAATDAPATPSAADAAPPKS